MKREMKKRLLIVVSIFAAVALCFGLLFTMTSKNEGADFSAQVERPTASTFDRPGLTPVAWSNGTTTTRTVNGTEFTQYKGYISIMFADGASQIQWVSGTIELYAAANNFVPVTMTCTGLGPSKYIDFTDNTYNTPIHYKDYFVLKNLNVKYVSTGDVYAYDNDVFRVNQAVETHDVLYSTYYLGASYATFYDYWISEVIFPAYWELNDFTHSVIVFYYAARDAYGAKSTGRAFLNALIEQDVKSKNGEMALYFLNTAGGDITRFEVPVSNRYDASCASSCTNTGSGGGGNIQFYYDSNDGTPEQLQDFEFICLKPTTICGITIPHDVTWYVPYSAGGKHDAYGFTLHSYKDNIIGIEHFDKYGPSDAGDKDGKAAAGITLSINGQTKWVSGIRVYFDSVAWFGYGDADMYDKLKISIPGVNVPKPVLDPNTVSRDGYTILSTEGSCLWIIWTQVDAAGNVTDVLQDLVDGPYGLKNFTIILKEGLTRNRISFSGTHTYCSNESNIFSETTNVSTVCVVVNNNGNVLNNSASEFRLSPANYNDIDNCYELHAAYSTPVADDETSAICGLHFFTVTYGSDVIDGTQAVTRPLVWAYTEDGRSQMYSGGIWDTYVTGLNQSDVGQYVYAKGDWVTSAASNNGFLTFYIGAVGAESIRVRIYLVKPTIELSTTTPTLSETVNLTAKAKVTYASTFYLNRPVTVSSKTGDFTATPSYSNPTSTITLTRGDNVGKFSLVLTDAKSGVTSSAITVKVPHTFAYALNLSSTMNVMFATETVTGSYSVSYAKVTDWKGNDYDLTTSERTAGGKTIWTFDSVSPHNAADMVNFSVRLVFSDGVETYNEDYSVSKSIVGYCYDVLNDAKYEGENELLTLMVDTLHYCSRAYEYVYSGSTCNWDATSSIEACANIGSGNAGKYTNAYNAATVTNKFVQDSGVKDGNTTTGIRMAYISAQVVVEGNPYINIVVAANSTFETGVTYTATVNGSTVDIEFVNTGVNYNNMDYVYLYSAKIMLAPTQFDDAIVVTCTHTASSKAMSLTYSVNSYVKRLAGGAREEACARAMYSYGKSAKDFAEYMSGYSDFV